MKKLIRCYMVLFFTLIPYCMFSQISSIDKKNGYKELKIGDSLSLHYKNLVFSRNWENKKVYSYSGKAFHEDFFGGKVLSLEVIFESDIICGLYIKVQKDFYTQLVDKTILNYPLDELEGILGKPTGVKSEKGEEGITYIEQWVGNRVVMNIYRLFKRNPDNLNNLMCLIDVMINSKSSMEKELDKKF